MGSSGTGCPIAAMTGAGQVDGLIARTVEQSVEKKRY